MCTWIVGSRRHKRGESRDRRLDSDLCHALTRTVFRIQLELEVFQFAGPPATDSDKFECHSLKSMVDTCVLDMVAHGPHFAASITTEVPVPCEVLLASSWKAAKSSEIFIVPTLAQDFCRHCQLCLQVHDRAPYNLYQLETAN